MTQSNEKNRPIKKIRVGNIEAAIWRREREGGYRRHHVTFERTFKNQEGKYLSLTDFNAHELLILREVAKIATDWMLDNDSSPAAVNA